MKQLENWVPHHDMDFETGEEYVIKLRRAILKRYTLTDFQESEIMYDIMTRLGGTVNPALVHQAIKEAGDILNGTHIRK